jgi:VCBS repeat-containing protein
VDGDPLTVSVLTGPAHGSLTLNADGSFDYTPDADYYGADSFTYEVSDGNGGTASATASITVNAVNDDPVAQNESYVVDEDGVLTIAAPGVLDNDTDVDGDPLTVSVLTGPAHGSLTLNADGSFDYTPDADYNGADSFTYEVSDGNGGTASATASITVNAVNDDPVAQNESYAVDEDGVLSIAAPGVLDNDTDVDGDPLTVSVLTGPAHGSLTLNADGSFDYTPDADYNGADSFTYEVSDGNGGTASATASITVNAVNDDPVAVNDGGFTTPFDTALGIPVGDLLVNDTDADGDTLSLVSVGSAVGGTVALVGGSVIFTPTSGHSGAASFEYTVEDGNGGSDTAVVTLSVGANAAPVAQNESYVVDEDGVLTIAAPGVLDNDTDVDGDPLTVSVLTGPAHGSLTLNADGSFDYTPDADY